MDGRGRGVRGEDHMDRWAGEGWEDLARMRREGLAEVETGL